MKHLIKDDVYYILDSNDNVLMSITLDNSVEGNQVVIKTQDEVYQGPINLIQF